MKNKENVLSDFLDMTFQSWTWKKMTQDEKDRFIEMINSTRIRKDALKGSYDVRWGILNSLYYAYLMGLGYTPTWRENKKEVAF